MVQILQNTFKKGNNKKRSGKLYRTKDNSKREISLTKAVIQNHTDLIISPAKHRVLGQPEAVETLAAQKKILSSKPDNLEKGFRLPSCSGNQRTHCFQEVYPKTLHSPTPEDFEAKAEILEPSTL